MDIIKLPAGELAPDDKDCIHIAQMPDGQYRIHGSALLACGDGDEVESVALIGGDLYQTFEEAENAGLAWAADQCVSELYVSTSS